MRDTFVTDVSVEGIEKKRSPRKHYVYVMYVTWSDGAVNVLYRRYSALYKLQILLLDNFPMEAGFANPVDRILPFLPGKILFGRSQVQKVALKRLQPIDEYCKALISLPKKISSCSAVLGFFNPTPEDIFTTAKQEPTDDTQGNSVGGQVSAPIFLEQYIVIADYISEGGDEVSLEANDIIEVISKHDSGWWLVKTEKDQGWVPSTYLEKISGQEEEPQRFAPGKEEQYIAVEEYTPEYRDEIALQPGALVQVLHKTLDGWWLIRSKGEEGRVPAMHLKKADERKASVVLEKLAVGVFEAKSRDQKYNEPEKKRRQRKDVVSLGLYSKENIEERFESLMMNKRSKPLPAPPRKRSVKEKAMQPSANEIKRQKKNFVVKDNFEAKAAGSVRLKKGQRLTVHEKRESGWWYVETDEQVGWAPASHLVGPPIEASDAASSGHSSPSTPSTPSSPESPTTPFYPPFTQTQGPKTTDYGHKTTNFSPKTPDFSPKLAGFGSVISQISAQAHHRVDDEEDDDHDYENMADCSSYENMFEPVKSPSDKMSNQSSSSTNGKVVQCQVGRAREDELKGKPVYFARACYRGAEETETDLEGGERVVVIEKAGGWWYVHAQAGDGWVPSHFLQNPASEPTKPALQPKPENKIQKYSNSYKSNFHSNPVSSSRNESQNPASGTEYSQPHKRPHRFGLQVMPTSVAVNAKMSNNFDNTKRNVQQLKMMFNNS